MGIVTAVKQQKKQDRVNVYVDGKFSFGLDLDNFVKFGIRVEMELSEGDIEKIKNASEYSKSLNKALRLASVRPRSEREVVDWFKRKNIPEIWHKSIIAVLKRYNMYGDRPFAEFWVSERVGSRPRSKKAISYELAAKGVSKKIREEVLSQTEIDESFVARELLSRKLPSLRRFEGEVLRKKSTDFLARKGFSWDTIKSVLNELGI